ncbi:MAG: alpha/beta hydrolase [Wenzhouxiangellaceae bacterium]
MSARPRPAPLRPVAAHPAGRVEWLTVDSAILAECNPLGDPVQRGLPVYLPPGHDEESGRSYPVLWSLAAYTSSGLAQSGWRNHGENLVHRLDRLIGERRLAPVIVAMPDCYTALGGNQYVDSPALGYYARHLVEELVPAVEARFRAIGEPGARGLFGKSSGGFGALHLACEYPDQFGGVACHAGDCGFDRVYQRDFVSACDELAQWEGDPEAFVRAFWRARKPSHRAFHTLMVLCLAASYSPAADKPLGLDLPFDLHTGRVLEPVWRRWLAFDPVRWPAQQLDRLAGLRGLWLDAGNRDQYYIHYGTRELHDILTAAGIAHHHEEFDGNHSGMDWRLDHSLPWLVSKLKQD